MRLRVLASMILMSVIGIAATGQELRNEVSVQGTGFFTKDSTGNGIYRTATNTGGVLAGYRFRINQWFSAEGNYGWDRNSQIYSSGGGSSRVQADVHSVTADLVINLPVALWKLSPYALTGGGGLIFRPTRNAGASVPGADTQTRGAFLYGGGVEYPLIQHFLVKAEYRGYVYKTTSFGLESLNLHNWTHTAQPSAGLTYRF